MSEQAGLALGLVVALGALLLYGGGAFHRAWAAVFA